MCRATLHDGETDRFRDIGKIEDSLVLKAFAEGDGAQRTLAALAAVSLVRQRRAGAARLRLAGGLRRLVAQARSPASVSSAVSPRRTSSGARSNNASSRADRNVQLIQPFVLRGKESAHDRPEAAEKNHIQRVGDLRVSNERPPSRRLRIDVRSQTVKQGMGRPVHVPDGRSKPEPDQEAEPTSDAESGPGHACRFLPGAGAGEGHRDREDGQAEVALAHTAFAFRRAAKPNPIRSTTAMNWAMVKRRRLMDVLLDQRTSSEIWRFR